MPQNTFSQERALILREILDKYHFNSGIAITGDRYFIAHRPGRLVKLHNGFGYLANAYVPPGKEEDYMRELKRIRDELKREYKKLIKKEERKKYYDRIKSVLKF